MKRIEALALLSTAGMLALSGCSTTSSTTSPASSGAMAPSGADTPSVTPVVETTATPTPSSSLVTTAPATARASTTAPTASATTGSTAGTAAPTSSSGSTGKPTATAPATKGATSQGLPESFAGWMRVDVDDSLGYPSAGYSSDAGTLRLQLRPATSPKALVTAATKGRYVPIGSTPCASSARMNACALATGNRVVLISSAKLETEELADLLPQAAQAIG